MYKQPLFGEDSSPHITSMLVSGIVTLVCWIIFCVLCFVIKFKPQTPQYKEVQIVLSSTPVVEKEKTEAAESASAQVFEENLESSQSERLPEPVEGQSESAPAAPAVEEAASVVPEPASVVPEPVEGPAKVETTPVAEAKVDAPKKTAAPTQTSTASAPAAKATDPAKKVNFDDYQYATDYSDFDFNNVSTSPSKNNFDWSQFDDSAEPEPQVSQQVKTVTTQSTMQGAAGQASTNKNQAQTSQPSGKTQIPQSACSATSAALSNIRNTTYSTSSGSNTKSITEAKTTKGSDGTLSMAMKDGSTRVLLNPVPPVIRLSEAAAALIDTTRTVTIEFHVLSSGNVPRGEITITPISLLPDNVRNEILDQLSRWQFESSAADARATFEYTIEKR